MLEKTTQLHNRIRQWVTTMNYKFDMDESEDEDETSNGPFREVGKVGKMPVQAHYDYDRIEQWARRALKALESEGAVTDEELASTIDLNRISQEESGYDPSEYRRRAAVESSDRNSTKQAHRQAKKRRAEDKKMLLYYHYGPVLSTHPDVAWRGAWSVTLDDAPADMDAVEELAAEFGISGPAQAAIAGMFGAAREIAVEEDRAASTFDLLDNYRVPGLSQQDRDEAARFLADEVPGISPPSRCNFISWADAPASWVYLPAQDTSAEEQEVADAGV
jgi:hypothetical protein